MIDPRLEHVWIIDVKAGRVIDGNPASNDLLVAPAIGHTGIEPAEHVEVVVEDRETADGNGKVRGQEFESGLDPGLTVRKAITAQKHVPYATGYAVVKPRHRNIDQLPPWHRHDRASASTFQNCTYVPYCIGSWQSMTLIFGLPGTSCACPGCLPWQRDEAYRTTRRSRVRGRLTGATAHRNRRRTKGKRVMDEFVEPLGMRVLIRKDESRQKTRGGIVLPDQAEIPTITGRVVEVSLQVERDADFPIEKYDKVLFHPKNSIPVDFEQDNLLYVVPIEDVVAVFRRHDSSKPRRRTKTDPDDQTPPH
jgi:chaperonin GroES